MCLAALVFLVTVGIPVFHHECSTTNSHDTQWFTFNHKHCKEAEVPSCCKVDKKDCCSITSSIIVLKSDQEHVAYLPRLSSVISVPIIFSSCFKAPFISKENKKVEERYLPPPNVRFGTYLLKFIQVFRL